MSVLSGTTTLESNHDSEGLLAKVHRDTTQPATTLKIYIYISSARDKDIATDDYFVRRAATLLLASHIDP